MAGLFTLDSESLGVLDEDVLGGFGTGFITGSSSSTGSVSGLLGHDGIVTGSNQSTGANSGAVGYLGAVAGFSAASGSAAGSPGFSGSVSGSQSSAGSVTGEEGNTGGATGSTSSSGSASGSPDISGAASGASTSSGSVTGAAPEPPEPPAPEPEPSGVAMPRLYLPRLEPIRRSGSVTGSSRARGRASGRCGYIGSTSGQTASISRITGRRSQPIPIEPRIRDHSAERRQHEEEALIMELL